MKSIFIFRRDIRLNDNTALIECFKKSDSVLPIFIFTPEQIDDKKNKYFSSNAFQFMIESLESLNVELNDNFNSQIHYFIGDNIEVLNKLLKDYKYDSIFFNVDYTPYARKRDDSIKEFCDKNGVLCNTYEDYLLMPIGTFLKSDGDVYQKYTPFKNNAKKSKIPLPNNFKFKDNKFVKLKGEFNLSVLDKYYEINPHIANHGGRDFALNILKNLQQFAHYDTERNNLNKKTTELSAYIKFGNVSIREVYDAILKKLGNKSVLIDQLLWREFYYYLIYYIPRILENGESLKINYDKIKWGNSLASLEAWKSGNTGFPGVDAGMREMNETGFMHNRARLITSGILIKILNCDWRLGEQYFAQKLVDYDPSVNNGNWQWSSGSGADSQPYFRILSPWRQTETNDPECEYIKKWIPELEGVANKDIHNWGEAHKKYKDVKYPKPIVNYDVMRKEIVNLYKKYL